MSKELDPNLLVDVSVTQSEPAEVNTDVSESAATAASAATESAEPNGFALLNLDPALLQAVQDLGFTQPTPVQSKTIPLAMQTLTGAAGYNDLMVSSQTGSGKTAAFLLPVLHTLFADAQAREAQAQAERQRAIDEAKAAGREAPKAPKRKNPLDPRNFKPATPGALILCPTRELAQQVAHDAIDLARHLRGVRVAAVVGGLPYRQQIERLQNASLVVATPGRLLDLQRSQQIKCEAVQFLVCDEADRMLDLGFADDLAEINQLTAQRRQTLMFSATFEPRIQALARRVMREPQRITIDSPQQRHANIRQALYWAENTTHKRKLLDRLMRDTTIDQAIVFASTQIECDALAEDLANEGFDAAALHGALSQRVRNFRLGLLRQGRIQFLVATDVASRGIDVPTITHVFNYGLPMKSEDYVHRIGRTGRAGREGLAITIADYRDRRKIGDIERYTQQRLAIEVVPGMEPAPPKRPPPSAHRDAPGHKRRAPKDFAPKNFAPKPFAPKPFAPRPAAPHDRAPRDAAPKDFAPRGSHHAPRAQAPFGHAPNTPHGKHAPRGALAKRGDARGVEARGNARGDARRPARNATTGPRGYAKPNSR